MSDQASTVDFSEAEAEPIVAESTAYGGVVGSPAVSEVVFGDAEAEPIEVPVREIEFSEDEAEPIVAPSTYDAAVQYPAVTHIDFGEDEAEPIVVPVTEIEFSEDENDPIIGRSTYDAALRSPAVTRIDFGEQEAEPIVGDSYAPAIDYRVKGGDPLLPPVDAGLGLTPAHRALLARPRIKVDPVEPWGTTDAAEAFLQRRMSRKGVSTFLADFKDRWVHAHRALIKAAASEFDVPDWVLGGVAWTEVGGDPPWFDEAGVKLRQFVVGDPNQTSFGPIQIQIRRAAEELRYDPAKLSAIQRRVLIWSLEDPQQDVFVVAQHLRRLKEITAPGVPGAQLTDDQVRFIGARYNRGPGLSDDVLRNSNTKLSYGEALVNKRQRVERLLSDQ
jgi:hypothetical protein